MNDELLKRMMPAMVAQVDAEMEAHHERQQAWDIFVASLRDRMAEDAKCGWSDLPACPMLYDIARIYRHGSVSYAYVDGNANDLSPIQVEIKQFAEGYGWPATLRALAQGMEADETLKKELDGRR